MPNFDELTEEEGNWLDAYLDGTISPEAFEKLQDRMLENPAVRQMMRRYLALDDSLRNEVEIDSEATLPWLTSALPRSKILQFPSLIPIAAAASIAFALGLGIMFFSSQPNSKSTPDFVHTKQVEPVAEGFAVVRRLFDVRWPADVVPRRAGEALGAEEIRIASGTVEIQFFSGATMTVQGPAEIILKSAWEATCRDGAVRMRVPPAARGFKLHTPATEIVDLGTEFGLQVREGEGHVEVFDGEIALRHRDEDEQILRKGNALSLAANGPARSSEVGNLAFPNVENFTSNAARHLQGDFERWQSYRNSLAHDDRLIAYYDFERKSNEALIPNLTVPRNSELDGAVILAETVNGRWPELKSALEFRRPGARVRVNIPGEFTGYSFICWVRIDSLDRWYNALFMADSYETGEPHWQIQNDGKMIVSVMVDDSWVNPKNPNSPPTRFQRLYYSPVMWDRSKSGQWMHLASVFDPKNRRVSHYVNGKRISRESILPQYQIDELRIGNAEIGNWGDPFREDSTFAIRNINGRMDEMAIFGEALQDEEIADLFAKSRAER